MTDFFFYPYKSLTGGGDGALDSLDGSVLKSGDAAFVVIESTRRTYIYTLDEDSAAAESSPDVIAPDSNAGDKRWILTSIVADVASLNFLQSGTGAVTRTAQAKMRESVTPEDFGAVGDGTTTDTTAVQAALDASSSLYLPLNKVYKVGTLTLPSTLRYLYGPGTLKQAVEDAKIIQSTTAHDLTIEGVSFLGASTYGTTHLNSGNRAIHLTDAYNVNILNCYFTLVSQENIYLVDCEDCSISFNRFYRCGLPIYLSGVNGCAVIGNRIKDTIFDSSVFCIAIALQSTEGGLNLCQHVQIIGNTIQGFFNAQGIFGHAGQHVTIMGNTVQDAMDPINFGPFNATDNINYLNIIGNVAVCGIVEGGYEIGNDAILVQGGPTSAEVTDIVIMGNTAVNGNRSDDAANQGGIRIGYTTRASIIGNHVIGSQRNGIVLTENEAEVQVHSNIISTTVVSGSTQNGILVLANSRGSIRNNIFRDHADATYGTAIKLTAQTNLSIEGNDYGNSTKAIVNTAYALKLMGNYVDRGDISSNDFETGSFTTDGSWHDLDLSSIIPIGTIAVKIRVGLTDDVPGSYLQFRKNGNSNVNNSFAPRVQANGIVIEEQGDVPCDEDRVIEYLGSSVTFASIFVNIVGWWI